MRFAIYYTPPRSSPLADAASAWLGRDVYTGDSAPAITLADLSAARIGDHTASPRHYGFHATIVAPFRAAEGVSERDVAAVLEAFCAKRMPVVIPRLKVAALGAFLALVPDAPVAALNALADEAVQWFQPCRAPLTQAEIARRRPDKLTPRQRALLHRWGYPYVMEEFRFHMTLTGPLPDDERETFRAALEDYFLPVLQQPVAVGGLALFIEPEPGAPFLVRRYLPFPHHAERELA